MTRERLDLLLGAFALMLLFVLWFVLLPVAAGEPAPAASGVIHESVTVVAP